MYIDCHAHILFRPIPAEAMDRDILGIIPTPDNETINNILSRAKYNRVKYIVGVISDPNLFSRYQEQLEMDNVIHIIGISRDHAQSDQSGLIKSLRATIDIKTPHGIGEIGLEYEYGLDMLADHEKKKAIDNQQQLLRKQIRLAKELKVPIVIHAGHGTDEDIVRILKQEQAQNVGGQIHGYMSDGKLVSELLGLGFYFSFGYAHTIEEELKQIIDIVPINRILVETDSPYHLFEYPKRFILPEDIGVIYDRVAAIKELNLEYLANQVVRNARVLFSF